MKITKYEHACLVIEENNQKLVIDPGIFSSSYNDYANVTGVVVTHVHPDHFDPEKLKCIVRQNPEVQLFTVQTVASELTADMPAIVVTDGQKLTCGLFELEFFGTNHALIHESIPLTKNTGVMVNNLLYYPGDALIVPHKPVSILAVPSSGPWLKIAESMDFVIAIKPQQASPTHNAILSDIGNSIHNRLLETACQTVGAQYTVMTAGNSLIT